ncbi:MAG: MaoC family dehydratase N-terminal domain-containing protein [Actinomycetota bacterium]|nr:MaoC family dehydratase N-terminal domain-containing protein [Actinomycetota bacterium]
MSSQVEPDIYFEDFTPGRVFELGTLVVDEAEMVAFAQRFDPQWYHVDRARAEASAWGRLIASGFFTVSALMRMYVDAVLVRAAADTSPGMENLRWFAPVYAGDELAAILTVTDAQPSTRSGQLGTVFLQWQMHRGSQLVLQMNGRGWFVRRSPLAVPPTPAPSPFLPPPPSVLGPPKAGHTG